MPGTSFAFDFHTGSATGRPRTAFFLRRPGGTSSGRRNVRRAWECLTWSGETPGEGSRDARRPVCRRWEKKKIAPTDGDVVVRENRIANRYRIVFVLREIGTRPSTMVFSRTEPSARRAVFGYRHKTTRPAGRNRYTRPVPSCVRPVAADTVAVFAR